MSDPSPLAGDFFSLLARHHASPLRAAVSPDAPVQTQATTVFAFHFADGVLMAVFAGVGETVSPPAPQIYFYDPLGAQFHAVGYAASGSGAGTIRSILSFQDRYGQPRPTRMNLQQAVQFALRLLMIASEFD